MAIDFWKISNPTPETESGLTSFDTDPAIGLGSAVAPYTFSSNSNKGIKETFDWSAPDYSTDYIDWSRVNTQFGGVAADNIFLKIGGAIVGTARAVTSTAGKVVTNIEGAAKKVFNFTYFNFLLIIGIVVFLLWYAMKTKSIGIRT